MQFLLDEYKSQQAVERGFRFLKSPDFLTSSLFLKKPERIEALLMIMTCSLMVYAGIEYLIRQRLVEQNSSFPDMKKLQKPEHEIYQYLLNNFSLNYEQTVFIDGNLENVNAAREIGIKSFLFDRSLYRINLIQGALFPEPSLFNTNVVDRQFLGYRLLSDGRLVIAPHSVKRIEDKVRTITQRNRRMRHRTYGGVRGRSCEAPPTRSA